MTNMHIEHFYYQAFIPSENRGGSYHVFLNDNGKIVGPLTPQQADAAGFSLSAIFADIDTKLAQSLDATRAALEKAVADNDAVMEKAKRIEATAALAVAGANEIVAAVSEHVSDKGREIIAREIEKLNAKLTASADPIRVADVGKPNETE